MSQPASLGRIVLVNERGVFEPAIVTTVHNATCINVRLLGEGESAIARRLCYADYADLGKDNRSGGWSWPPRV